MKDPQIPNLYTVSCVSVRSDVPLNRTSLQNASLTMSGPADSAREALVLHRALFGPENENAPRIREILQRALDDYRRETRVRRVVGFEFRRYVRNRPSSQFEAFQTLTDLDLLFRRHRSSGLVPAEYRRIQAVWLEEIAPEGISIRELGQAIHPSRYVRGSDILDIFGD